jgi:dihydropteroate synthase
MASLFCSTATLDLSTPAVMGILNLAPDSFFDGGRYADPDALLRRVEQMVREGASIIDIGAVSTRPGAEEIAEEEECRRLMPPLERIVRHFPGIIISVDTYRSRIAREALEQGASVINDIYGGRFDDHMIEVAANYHAPIILMHMKGTPATMQDNPTYSDVVAEINYFFEKRMEACRAQGVRQVVIDPGFGFGKTAAQNFMLLARLQELKTQGVPVAVGLSRKSMIFKSLKITPNEALNGTTVLNTIALLNGADLLRVHDVKEAVEAVRLVGMMQDVRHQIREEGGNFEF